MNSWRDHDLRRALRPLARLAEETGVAILSSRHLNKANAGPALYRGGGSIAFTAAARAEFLVAVDPDHSERRILASVKANLAPHQPSLAYRLEGAENGVARIVWGGSSKYTANELVTTIGDAADQDVVQLAVTFLREELGAGPCPTAQVEKAARAEGISRRSLERARSRLGVEARKVGGRDGYWELHLPPEAPPAPPDGNAGGVGGLRERGANIESSKDRQGRHLSLVAEFDAGAAAARRSCPRCGRPMNHYGADLQAGWVCATCYPAADRALRGGQP